MNRSGFSAVATQRVEEAPVTRRRPSAVAKRRELEGRLTALQKDYAELHAEIFEAAQIHRRLCAPRLVRYSQFEIASEIFAVHHLAGDFVTINERDGRVVFALADICGKGLAAGMWTTHLVGRVNFHATINGEPQLIASEVNKDVCMTGKLAPLASLFVAQLDPISGKLDYCSAGHPPAMLLRADGRLEWLSDGGLLLGVVPTASYTAGSVQLDTGDVLLAYSDGVIESRNTLEEEFGQARLETQLRAANSLGASAESLLFSVLAAVQDFAGTHPLVDDLSMAVIRRDADTSFQSQSLDRLHLFF
ncbi:MAG TPA: PP2C family protein-serine/threonine phosphatase [Pyrinomonadaceae bacterium]|nr:PP2C family protein-serine/threonine phosphatase [Pyrinomonadaceae bacterium]